MDRGRLWRGAARDISFSGRRYSGAHILMLTVVICREPCFLLPLDFPMTTVQDSLMIKDDQRVSNVNAGTT